MFQMLLACLVVYRCFDFENLEFLYGDLLYDFNNNTNFLKYTLF